MQIETFEQLSIESVVNMLYLSHELLALDDAYYSVQYKDSNTRNSLCLGFRNYELKGLWDHTRKAVTSESIASFVTYEMPFPVGIDLGSVEYTEYMINLIDEISRAKRRSGENYATMAGVFEEISSKADFYYGDK